MISSTRWPLENFQTKIDRRLTERCNPHDKNGVGIVKLQLAAKAGPSADRLPAGWTATSSRTRPCIASLARRLRQAAYPRPDRRRLPMPAHNLCRAEPP